MKTFNIIFLQKLNELHAKQQVYNDPAHYFCLIIHSEASTIFFTEYRNLLYLIVRSLDSPVTDSMAISKW